jgi:hypothetical protein
MMIMMMMMIDVGIVDFLRANGIDSFQKLRFLLFLQQRPGTSGTSQELAEQLYFGDQLMFANIIFDLQSVGLLDRMEDRYKLRDEHGTREALQRLAEAFDNPVTRQELLGQICLEPQRYDL